MLVIPEPVHTAQVLNRHAARETMIRQGQANIQAARDQQRKLLEAAITVGNDPRHSNETRSPAK
jgi:hypothetical protein